MQKWYGAWRSLISYVFTAYFHLKCSVMLQCIVKTEVYDESAVFCPALTASLTNYKTIKSIYFYWQIDIVYNNIHRFIVFTLYPKISNYSHLFYLKELLSEKSNEAFWQDLSLKARSERQTLRITIIIFAVVLLKSGHILSHLKLQTHPLSLPFSPVWMLRQN